MLPNKNPFQTLLVMSGKPCATVCGIMRLLHEKRTAVVIMQCEPYIAEAYRELSHTDVYQQVSSNEFLDVIEEVKDCLFRS